MAGDVVHRQVVHVGLDEFESLIFDHLHSLLIQLCTQIAQLFARKTKTSLGCIVDLLKDRLDVGESTYALTHAQAEVSEPLVVQRNSPVFAQEFDDIRDDTCLVPTGELIEVVLVQPDEAPQTLKDDLLIAHVSH